MESAKIRNQVLVYDTICEKEGCAPKDVIQKLGSSTQDVLRGLDKGRDLLNWEGSGTREPALYRE